MSTTPRPLLASHFARVAAALVLVLCAVAMHYRVAESAPRREPDDLLYLPNERLLTHFTAGLSPVIADLIWVQCCTYVGRQVQTEWDFQWLQAMLDTVVRLDPYFVPAYRFGAMFLSSLKAEPDAAMDLLQRGMVINPQAWELPYEAAMIYLLNRRNEPDSAYDAAFYLALAVDTGNAPAHVAETAAALQGKYNLIGLERKMWEAMANSDDGLLRDLARTKLEEVRIKQNIDVLNQQLEKFRQEHGAMAQSLDELVSKGYMREIPPDVFGGKYLLGPDGQVINSTLLDNAARDARTVIENAIGRYREQEGHAPDTLEQLVQKGYLPALPAHPWPGKEWFYESTWGVLRD